MIVDKDGKEVTVISCVKYTNLVEVMRDGQRSTVHINDLKSTLGRKDFVESIRKIQTKA